LNPFSSKKLQFEGDEEIILNYKMGDNREEKATFFCVKLF